jgi:hypothetical protein
MLAQGEKGGNAEKNFTTEDTENGTQRAERRERLNTELAEVSRGSGGTKLGLGLFGGGIQRGIEMLEDGEKVGGA